MDSWHWNNIRGGVSAVLVDVSRKKKLPKHWPIPAHTHDLFRYLTALEFQWGMEAIALLTEKTLEKAAKTLDNAHVVAAKVKVSEPNDELLRSVQQDLEEINSALQNEERFRVAFQFSMAVGAMAKRV